MRLQNGDVLFGWPLEQHVITAGWFYNDGTAHRAIDLRTAEDGNPFKPVFAAEDGVVDWTQDWDGVTRTGMQSYGTEVLQIMPGEGWQGLDITATFHAPGDFYPRSPRGERP